MKIYTCLEALTLIVRLQGLENQPSMTLMTKKLNENFINFIKKVIYIVKTIHLVEQYTTGFAMNVNNLNTEIRLNACAVPIAVTII